MERKTFRTWRFALLGSTPQDEGPAKSGRAYFILK